MGLILADTCWPDTAVLFLTLTLLLYYWATCNYNYWQNKGVATVSKITPFFGSLKDAIFLKRQMGLHFTDMYHELEGERFGGYYKLRQPALMVRDPALIKNIVVKDFNHFYDNDIHADEKTNPVFAYNLFGMKGAKWKYARSKFSPIFSSGKIRGMFPLMLDVCEELKEKINKLNAAGTPEFEAKNLCANYTTNVVATCAFGLKINCFEDEDNKFRRMGKEVMNPSKIRGFIIMLLFFFPALSNVFAFFDVKFMSETAVNFFRDLVREAFEFREQHGIFRNDLIDLLMMLKKKGTLEEDSVKAAVEDETGKFEFTHDVLTAQAVGFFFDGYETSSITLSFAMHELAMNRDIQSRLRDILRSTALHDDGKLNYEAVTQCAYLEQILLETTRKHPVAGVLTKVCTKRYQIPDTKVKIEIGTPIAIPVDGLHHDPAYFPEPDVFDPERFSEENKDKRVPFSYVAFGEGPRQCIGVRFAKAQIKAALATLVTNFELLPSAKTSEKIVLDPNFFMASAIGGLHMQAVPLAE